MSNYKITLDISNTKVWEQAINSWTNAYTQAIEDGQQEFVSRFKDKLLENMTLYGVNDPEVLNCVVVTYNKSNNVMTVMMDGGQVQYIEYGVGIIGSQSPHPSIGSGWKYDINNHGDKGWVYKPQTNIDGAYNDYLLKNGYAWTKGHSPRPFFYDTYMWGLYSYSNIIRSYLRRAIK